MNWRGDSHGRQGIRMKRDGRSKPYYGRVRFQGRDIHTKDYATADQAAMAREILEAVLTLSSHIPQHRDPIDPNP